MSDAPASIALPQAIRAMGVLNQHAIANIEHTASLESDPMEAGFLDPEPTRSLKDL